jgi:uncharacterized membrane protein YagU involved in acid resistance
MSSSTRTRSEISLDGDDAWKGGVLAGIAGGLAMGALMLAMGATDVLGVAIPSLYTLAPPAAPGLGLIVHVSHGAVLGLIFAAILTAVGVEDARTVVAAGVGYGVVTWVLLAALLMPLWLAAVGSPAQPPFPNFAVPSLLWHAVYGVVLGAVFVAVDDLF